MFQPVLRPSSGKSIQKPYKGSYNKHPFYVLTFSITTVKKGSLRFFMYLYLGGFCITMPEDGVSTGQNM